MEGRGYCSQCRSRHRLNHFGFLMNPAIGFNPVGWFKMYLTFPLVFSNQGVHFRYKIG